MFNRFSKILHNAVDALQPAQPLHQEFIGHWKAITSYFMENKEHKTVIDQTGIPGHLDQMLRILQDEEYESESGSTAPAMEYLLQHKILETLYTLARTDCPPGMKQQVLQFFTKLLSRIHQPLLPHINVYRAVHRLIRVCGETKAAPSENEEIHFLCTICGKICQNPYFVNFFIDKNTVTDGEGHQTDISSFGLIEALLALLQSADGRVSVKACEGLLLCSSLSEAACVNTICKNTSMCDTLTEKLCELYRRLDKPLLYQNYTHIHGVHAKWGLDMQTISEDRQSFSGKRGLISFLSWWDYCDQFISAAQPQIADQFVDRIRQSFFNSCIKPDMLQASESSSIVSTVLLTHCLRVITSKPLQDMLIFSLVEKDLTDFTVQLINRCHHVAEEISVVTLKLFEVLLQKPEPHITETLMINNLKSRSYVSNTPPDSSQSSSNLNSPSHNDVNSPAHSDANDESPAHTNVSQDNSAPKDAHHESPAHKDAMDMDESAHNDVSNSSSAHIDIDSSALIKDDNHQKDTTENSAEKIEDDENADQRTADSSLSCASNDSDGYSPSVQQIVQCFLSMLPDGAKSCFQSSESGYDTYLRDAFKQYSDVMSQCRQYDWPIDLTEFKVDDQQQPSFVEPPFIKVLLDKLSHILDQGYDSNLQVTCVISQLCLLPHPLIHEYLLNPYLNTKGATRTLCSVIRKVVHDIEKKMANTADFKKELLIVRKRLIGMDDSIRRSKPQGTRSRIDDTMVYEGVIVLEEFCKELAAITFVKHHSVT